MDIHVGAVDIHVGAVVSLAGRHMLGAGWRLLRTLTALGWTGWRKLRAWRRAAARWRMPIWALGGVTTLRHPLNPRCNVCRQKIARRNEVRTLSCNHTLHKACVDLHLRVHDMACSVCSRTATFVRPWKPPPSHLVKEVHHGRRGVWTLEEDIDYDCMICLEMKAAEGVVRTLACLHIFHFACITKWLREENNRCPLFRKPDIPVPQKETRLSAMRKRIGAWFRRFSAS